MLTVPGRGEPATGLPRDPWWQAALDFLLPPRCVGCGLRGQQVCADCAASMRPLGPEACPQCSLPSSGGKICGRCRTHPLALRAIVAAHPFDGVTRAAILAFKYRAHTRLAGFLGSPVVAALQRRPLAIDVVAPVPLSRGRLRSRGFNPAELLAVRVAHAFSWPLDPDLLMRIRETPPQIGLNARDRRRNVAGAFDVAAPEAIEGKRVLLVDDVCTTGATLDACAAALGTAGAQGVWAAVVAREVLGRGPTA